MVAFKGEANNNDENKQEYVVINKKNSIEESGNIDDFSDIGWAPTGSLVFYEEGKMKVEAPDGWVYVGYVDDKPYVSSSGKTAVSCTCNTSGSCLPVKVKYKRQVYYGCYGDCSNCTMKQSDESKVEIENGGFINLHRSPDFVTDTDEDLPMAFDAMFEIPQVLALLEKFLIKIYPLKDYPSLKLVDDSCVELPYGYKFAPVNLCGRALLVAVPESEIINTTIPGGSSATCTCTMGKCSVKEQGPVVRCVGDCTGTCTLYDKDSGNVNLWESRAFNH